MSFLQRLWATLRSNEHSYEEPDIAHQTLKDHCSVAPTEIEQRNLAQSEHAVELPSQDAQRGRDRQLTITYWVFTMLIGLISLSVALATRSLGKVFSLSGATGFTLVCNICPPWLYLTVAPPDAGSTSKVLARLLLLYGLVTMPVCIIANLIV